MEVVVAPSPVIEGVLPLDDADLLERAKPITPDGRVQLDPKDVMARHDGQVRLVLGKGPLALIVLGGAHDPSDSARRLGDGRCV
jgi:hypothetical protein